MRKWGGEDTWHRLWNILFDLTKWWMILKESPILTVGLVFFIFLLGGALCLGARASPQQPLSVLSPQGPSWAHPLPDPQEGIPTPDRKRRGPLLKLPPYPSGMKIGPQHTSARSGGPPDDLTPTHARSGQNVLSISTRIWWLPSPKNLAFTTRVLEVGTSPEIITVPWS